MYYPAQIASNYIQTGKTKAALSGGKMLMLSILAGAFIALGAAGTNTIGAGFANPVFSRIAAGLLFPAGLAMVLLAGAELFTGNTLLVIPLYEKQITVAAMLRNWGIVYVGNLIGGLLVVLLLMAGGQWGQFYGDVAVYTIKIAVTKTGYSFGKCLALGIGCNFLVCIAVWMSYAADSPGGKVAAFYLPIALFVMTGFEHSVANMYYIPAGIMAAQNSAWVAQAAAAGIDAGALSWGGFIGNLLPATIGNIIGGSLLVGTPYWYVYLKTPRAAAQKENKAA